MWVTRKKSCFILGITSKTDGIGKEVELLTYER